MHRTDAAFCGFLESTFILLENSKNERLADSVGRNEPKTNGIGRIFEIGLIVDGLFAERRFGSTIAELESN